MFTLWAGDDFGDVDEPKKSKKKTLVRKKQQQITKKPETRLEERTEVKDVVQTPSGPVAVSAVATEYSVGDAIKIDTIDIDAENIKTEATLKVDAFVVSETATGAIVCGAGVVEYAEKAKDVVIPPSIETRETVPIESSDYFIDLTQRKSSAGKKKKDKKDKKKSKKEKKKEKQSTLIESEDQLYQMALSQHSEGKKKTKQPVTISSEQELREYINEQRSKHSGDQYGAYFDPSTNSMQGGRSTVDVSVPLAPRLQVGSKKQHAEGDGRILDVQVPFVGVQAGEKKPVNIITKDADMDEYIKDMMEMREAGMAKKTPKEGEFTRKQNQKYQRKQKFMVMLKQHETQVRDKMNAMSEDPSSGKKRQIMLKMLEFIELTERIVAKSKPEEINRVYGQYSDNMKKFNALLNQ